MDNYIFYDIIKDGDDVAVYGGYAKVDNSDGRSGHDCFLACLAEDCIPSSRSSRPGLAGEEQLTLSMDIEKGKNTYCVRLDPKTGAEFGPSGNPIEIVPHSANKWLSIIKNIKLYDGLYGRKTWLLFEVDFDHVQRVSKRIAQFFGEHGAEYFKVPFYYDLWDINRGIPLWVAVSDFHSRKHPVVDKNGHEHQTSMSLWHGGLEDHDGDYGARVHGGAHPNRLMQAFFLPIPRGANAA